MTGVLNAAAMLNAAEKETGLRDYGDPTLAERFGLAVEIIKTQGMDADGERKAAGVCHWLLTSRLEFFADRDRYPVSQEVIDAPLFATGEPRSGTTLLHALMSVDPDARALRFWEVMYPSPPPGVAEASDARRAQADADWVDILERLPKWLVSHPYNDMLGDGLPECERTWAFDFRVMTPSAWWKVPMTMIAGELPTDAVAQYRIHKAMLQQFQYARPRKYWVLKGFHSFRLPAMFDAYPDANMIWVHRDPVQVAASLTMMAGDLIEGLTGKVDWKAQAEKSLNATRMSTAATLANPMIDDPRIYHVRYGDFVADPVGTIRGFYEHSGKAFTPQAADAMATYLRENKGDRHGKFKYSPDILGEDIDRLHEEFAPFRALFGVEIEQRR